MAEVPERIYLQVGPDCGPEDLDGVTWHGEEVCWCDRQVFDTDVEYVRADLYAARIAELEGVVERLPKTKDGVPIYPGMTVHGWGAFGQNGHTTEVLIESARVYPDHKGNLRIIGSDFVQRAESVYATAEAARKAEQ